MQLNADKRKPNLGAPARLHYMKPKSTSQSAFFNLRVLIGLFVLLAGVFLALPGFGTYSSVSAQTNENAFELKLVWS